MKFRKKSYGVLPKIIHNPVEYAISGRPAVITAAASAENGNVPDRLWLYVKNGGKYEMRPSDSLEAGDIDYEIYETEIPAEETTGPKLSYAIAEDGFAQDITDYYTVKMIAEDMLPPLPPLMLTELYLRPKNLSAYVEVMNPGEADVDLYDYEMLFFGDKKQAEGKPTCRMPMADKPGTILESGKVAAIWGLLPKNFGQDGRDLVSPDDFVEIFNNEYNNREHKIAVDGSDGREIRIIPVDYTVVDAASGKRKLAKGIGDLPVKHYTSVFAIVPRGGEAGSEVYSTQYSTVFASWDTPVKRSSYWTIDRRRPDKGVNICHYAEPTPGYFGEGQAPIDPAAAMPLIIPVCPVQKIYLGDGDLDLSFAVVAADRSRTNLSARVSVIKDGKPAVYPASEKEDGFYHAVIPYEEIEFSDNFTYYITVSDGTRSTSTEDAPVTVPVYDNAGPRIISMTPTDKYVFDISSVLEIKANWIDKNGTDIDRCRLELDGQNKTQCAEWKNGSVRMPLKKEKGEHTLKLVLFDGIGNRTSREFGFGISDMSELNVYRGEVHCHTTDSDGSGYPADAYAYARDVGNVDYFAVTDHSHYIDSSKYRGLVKTAAEFDEPGKFAAIHGFEMTWSNLNGIWGHVNVLNTDDCLNNVFTNDLPDLYQWMAERPEAVGMFNHPGYPWGDFDEYDHMTDSALRQMNLSEIKGPFYDFEYGLSLSKGWKVSPVSNEDNHMPNWTTATKMGGCVLAPALTRQNILDAFRAGRTYTTSDSTMKIFYKINGAWLGSTLEAPEKLNFDIVITTEDPKGIGLVEIVAEDGIVVAARDAGVNRELKWKPVLPPDFDYYYLRITGTEQYCVTGPVYLTGRSAPVIEKISFNASYNPVDTVAASAIIKNDGETELTDTRVSFYLMPRDGFRLSDAEPFKTVHIGKLKAGCRATVSVLLPERLGNRTAYVFASGERGKKRKQSVGSAMICSVRIAEILTDSLPVEKDGVTIANPFPYATIFNSSLQPVSLKGGRLCPWVATGKQPPEPRCASLDAVTIPGRSAAVIWDRSACPGLTVDDFNERYGLSLIEGKDIFPTTTHFIENTTNSTRLDLRIGAEVISRANLCVGLDHTGEPHPGKAFEYVYNENRTGTLTFTGYADPTPDSIDEEQRGVERVVLPGRSEKKLAKKAEKKDRKAIEHKEKAKLTPAEGAGIAIGAAAATGAVVGAFVKLFGKKKN